MHEWGVQPVTLPGSPATLAAGGPDGPVYALTGAPAGLRLCALEPDGAARWDRRVDGRLGPRVADDGGIWLAGSDFLEETRPAGVPGRRVALAPRADRRVGAFVVLPDGFLVAWATDAPPTRAPVCVERLDAYGARRWSTDLPTPDLPRPARAFRSSRWESLLVSGDRVLATFFEALGGLGVSYCVDLDTGHLVWRTEPAPTGHRAIAGAGRFLLGFQGYGAFTMSLMDPDGATAVTWPSHGRPLVGADGVIRVVELENTTVSRSRVRLLHPDGTMTDGPVLPGYYTVGPVLATDGRMAFWRDSRLQSAAPDLTVSTRHTLLDQGGVDAMLLLDGGRLAFTLGAKGERQRLFFADSDLPGPAEGVWTCAEGNLRANPVAR